MFRMKPGPAAVSHPTGSPGNGGLRPPLPPPPVAQTELLTCTILANRVAVTTVAAYTLSVSEAMKTAREHLPVMHGRHTRAGGIGVGFKVSKRNRGSLQDDQLGMACHESVCLLG